MMAAMPAVLLVYCGIRKATRRMGADGCCLTAPRNADTMQQRGTVTEVESCAANKCQLYNQS
jgi:hypothetical protein